jgi:hypothetical protein
MFGSRHRTGRRRILRVELVMTRSKPILYWTPRLLGLLAAVFLSLFALDVFGAGHGFWGTLLALSMHLIPSAIVLAALAIAWRWEVAGGLLFIAAGVAYMVTVNPVEHPSWVLAVAGPLWITGALFLLSHALGAGAPAVRQAA